MRRLLLASLALLLTLLPFQASGPPAPERPCCAGCQGMPGCPPRCPAPPAAPCPSAAGIPQAVVVQEAARAEAARAAEPLPAPQALQIAGTGPATAQAAEPRPAATGPPDLGDRQAVLRIFRI